MSYKKKIVCVSPRGNTGSEKPGLMKDVPPHGRILELDDL